MANSNGRSCGRRCRGWRKLQRCPLMVEEAVVLSLDGGKSCTWKQRQWKELRTKARPLDSSVGDRGSLSPMRQRQRQRYRKRRLQRQKLRQGLWLGVVRAVGFASTVKESIQLFNQTNQLLFNRTNQLLFNQTKLKSLVQLLRLSRALARGAQCLGLGECLVGALLKHVTQSKLEALR